MRVLYYLADMFIDTFGITRPTARARRQAAFFILTLLVLAIGAAALAFALLHGVMK